MVWLDVTKGLAILWVVYFHLFTTAFERRGHLTPSPIEPGFLSDVTGPHAWDGLATSLAALGRILGYGISQLGFHAVGLFLIVSGFSLYQSTARKASAGISWKSWYEQRLLRLYPMYWMAHLVYLISPLEARVEPVDERFLISLTGLRMIHIDYNFFYLNAAWWYFTLLIQLYLVFPILFEATRRWGAWKMFAVAAVIGMGHRYYAIEKWWVQGQWILGGCGISRLPEFAFGILLGVWREKSPEKWDRLILGGSGLALGLGCYAFTLWLYPQAYWPIDLLSGISCFFTVTGVAALVSRVPVLSRWLALAGTYSYGIYLVHQPYMIRWGTILNGRPIWMFALGAVAAWMTMILWGSALEKGTNALTQWVLGSKKSNQRKAAA